MKKLLVLVIGFFCCTCAIADEIDFRCLVSVGAKKPIRLQFTFPPDSSNIGRVVYEGGSGYVEVKRRSERTIREVPNGRPWVFESTWDEVTKKGLGGTYVIVTQGALIYDFKYLRKRDGKVFRFKSDPDVEGDEGCDWTMHKQ